ncbi:MAG: DUF1365 family protein, partial [bacterium]
SPYMPMDMGYELYCSYPDDNLTVHMNSYRNGTREFDATLNLQQKPFDESYLNSMLWSYPFMTVKVLGAIYFEALRLWWQGATFHSHPQHKRMEET